MKSRLKFLSFAVLLLAFAGCQKNEVEQSLPEGYGVEAPELPTEDQMDVTTDIAARIYGTPGADVSFEKSFVSRFKNVESGYNPETTRVCVITSGALKTGQLMADDYLDLYDCYSNGGIIFLTSPDADKFYEIFQVEMCLAYLHKIVTEYNVELNGETIDLGDIGRTFFNIGQVDMDKLKDNVMYDGLGLSNSKVFICNDQDNPALFEIKEENEEGTVAGTDIGTIEINGYEYGRQADAAVEWISRNFEQTKAAPKLQEVMDAYTITKTHDAFVPNIYPFVSEILYRPYETYEQVVSETFSIYTAHDVANHTTYYQIDQKADFHSGLINPVPDSNAPEKWHRIRYFLNAPYYYVCHFSEWLSKLKLVPGGKDSTPEIIYSGPEAANSSTEYSTSIYHGTMSSQSKTMTAGLSFDIGSLLGINASYSHTWESGTSYECQVGTSCSKQDIEIEKNTSVDKDGLPVVEWHYMGNKARGEYSKGDKGKPLWRVGKLLISDMNQVNSLLYKIPADISGNAKLYYDEQIWYRTCYFQEGEDIRQLDHKGRGNVFQGYITLPTPYRSIQHWILTFEEFGDVPVADRMEFQKFVEEKLLSKGTTFDMQDVDDKSTKVANGVLKLFMDDFKMLENNIKAFGYSGTFVFKLECAALNKELTASYTIK